MQSICGFSIDRITHPLLQVGCCFRFFFQELPKIEKPCSATFTFCQVIGQDGLHFRAQLVPVNFITNNAQKHVGAIP